MSHVEKTIATALTSILIFSLAPAHAERANAPGRSRAERERSFMEGIAPAVPGSRCAGIGYEMTSTRGTVVCTHGPDPAPAGVDPTQSPSLSELRADAFGSPTALGGAGSVPCVGDGQTGNRVQAIYGYAEGNDNSASVIPLIRQFAYDQVEKVVEDSAAQNGATRYVRFVTESTGSGCELSVKKVKLTAASLGNFGNSVNQLASLGYNAPNRKYMLWVDANVAGICGIAQQIPDDSPGQGNQNNASQSFIPGLVARMDRGCWGDSSSPTPTEAHELLHTLGAVQASAPHATNAGHCTDNYDVMCYEDGSGAVITETCTPQATYEPLLDCNDDDYFHAGSPGESNYLHDHWNTARSSFLSQTLEACTKTGGPGDNVMKGTPGKDILCGGGGNDTFKGLGGDDIFSGGPGTDKADYSQVTAPIKVDLALGVATGSGVGRDTLGSVEIIAGGPKADQLYGDNGPNHLIGGGGGDDIKGEGGNDKLIGSGGEDILEGGLGSDRVDGGPSADAASFFWATAKVTANLGSGKATGQGTDTLFAIEDVIGSAKGDKITGNNGPNFVVSGGGADYIYGVGGDDVLFGGDGSDYIYGGGGNYDFLGGNGGNDFLFGEAGADGLDGGPGTDKCVPGPGAAPYRISCEKK